MGIIKKLLIAAGITLVVVASGIIQIIKSPWFWLVGLICLAVYVAIKTYSKK